MFHRMEYWKSVCCIGVDFACRRCGTMERGQGWNLPTATEGGGSILICDKCRDDYERNAQNAVETACIQFVSDALAS